MVVVDQFEEIFTLCRDRSERWRFVDQLLAAKDADGRLRVVVAVGAGFHSRCVEHPGLAQALRHTTLSVGPMTREELRDAVVRPATAAGGGSASGDPDAPTPSSLKKAYGATLTGAGTSATADVPALRSTPAARRGGTDLAAVQGPARLTPSLVPHSYFTRTER